MHIFGIRRLEFFQIQRRIYWRITSEESVSLLYPLIIHSDKLARVLQGPFTYQSSDEYLCHVAVLHYVCRARSIRFLIINHCALLVPKSRRPLGTGISFFSLRIHK